MNISSRSMTIIGFFLACIAVLSQWGFWDKGVFSVGFNTTFVGAIFWCLLLKSSDYKKIKSDWVWYLPLWLILLSFAIFENPWLKLISIMLLPIVTGYIYSYRQIRSCDSVFWEKELASKLVRRTFSPLKYLGDAKSSVWICLKPESNKKYGDKVRKVLIGLLLLIPLASVALVLLTSADSNFEEFVTQVLSALLKNLELSILFKVILIAISTILILAMLLAWQRELDLEVNNNPGKRLDDIVAGIVVTGILLIYISFLFFQIEYLLINDLPTDLLAAEKIVKSGFWQLFLLSFINALMFFIVYKNTSKTVQLILRAFILASGLVVLSGCWRMGLYVYWYGFSYEKFFASYTAFYALLVFVFLSVSAFSSSRKDIFRFIALSSLWFYALAALLPVERIIFYSNIHFAERAESRIDLFHLSDLSLDIVNDVKREIEGGRLNSDLWSLWLLEKQIESCQERWFESNISRLQNCE